MRSKALALAVLVLALVVSGPAGSVIVSTSGSLVETTSPISLLEGDTESSTEFVILDEGPTVLSGEIFVNKVGPGLHTGSSGTPIPIATGTLVNTYIVHFDPAGGVITLSGGVTFEPDEIILGIQTHTPWLDGADGIVGDPMTTYPTGLLEFRAFESLPGLDSLTIDPSLESVSFTLIAELGIDQARIVTTVVPEPGTASLLALGLGALALRGKPAGVRRPRSLRRGGRRPRCTP
ncbi:MAG: PEP-CTERM sorting domain-containing protein [Myxococcota bacterium]